MREIWKHVKGFDNYAISNYGRLSNVNRDRAVEGRFHENGSIKVALSQNGRLRDEYLHILVAEHFLKQYTPGVQVKHIDGDKLNNRSDNLYQFNYRLEVRDTSNLKYQRSKRVILHQTGDIYRSPVELAHAINGDPSNIYRVLRGERRSYKGLSFDYID